jgi:flavin-dependent dehydrogenase
VQLYLFRGGYAGLAPIEGGRVNLCLLVTRSVFAEAGASVPAMVDAAVRMNHGLGRQLRGAQIVAGSEVAVAPVDTGRAASPWDRLARVGDAAVMIPPLCGDGMAMALRCAELCAPLADDFLRGSCSLAAWEAAYRSAWHREFDRPVRVGRRLQALLGTRGVASAMLGLGTVLRPLPNWLVRATRGAPRPLA